MVVELELELNWDRERKLTPKMLLELVEEVVVEGFHSLVLDSLESDCLELDSLDCLELGSLELDSLELGSPELGSLELGSLELDSLELGSLELDSLELEHEAPEALEALLLGSVVQLLSYCVRRLDTIVQVWDWPDLAWKIADLERLSLLVVQ